MWKTQLPGAGAGGKASPFPSLPHPSPALQSLWDYCAESLGTRQWRRRTFPDCGWSSAVVRARRGPSSTGDRWTEGEREGIPGCRAAPAGKPFDSL